MADLRLYRKRLANISPRDINKGAYIDGLQISGFKRSINNSECIVILEGGLYEKAYKTHQLVTLFTRKVSNSCW